MYSHHQPPQTYDPFLEPPIHPQPLMLQGFVVYPGYFRQDISTLSANVINYYQHHPKLILSQLTEYQFDQAFANILPHWHITHLSLQYLIPAVVSKILEGINFNLITHINLSDIDTVSVQAVYNKILKLTEENPNVIRVTCRADSITDEWQRRFNYLAETRVAGCRHLDFLNTQINNRNATLSRLETDAFVLQGDFDNQSSQKLRLQNEVVRMRKDSNNQQLASSKLASDLAIMQDDLNKQQLANKRQKKDHKEMLAEMNAKHDLALQKAQSKTRVAKEERDAALNENGKLKKEEELISLKSLSTHDENFQFKCQVKELQDEIATLNATILKQRDISRQRVNKVTDTAIICEAIYVALLAKSRAISEINNKKRKRCTDSGYSSSDSSDSSSSEASTSDPAKFRSGSPTPSQSSTSSSSAKSESSAHSASDSSVQSESLSPSSQSNSFVKSERSNRESSPPSSSSYSLIKRERSIRESSPPSSTFNSLVKKERSSKESPLLSKQSSSPAGSRPVPSFFKIRLKRLTNTTYEVAKIFKL
jgi:hypothetical protein